ncbi:hypothetical protein Scep_006651 [Stephania cephalantha]|uniref:Uncharacterized protein n=1 Tax=Stephania cephalantha TaxID=152367 RepID=A0AAP0PMF5_9MAGN
MAKIPTELREEIRVGGVVPSAWTEIHNSHPIEVREEDEAGGVAPLVQIEHFYRQICEAREEIATGRSAPLGENKMPNGEERSSHYSGHNRLNTGSISSIDIALREIERSLLRARDNDDDIEEVPDSITPLNTENITTIEHIPEGVGVRGTLRRDTILTLVWNDQSED